MLQDEAFRLTNIRDSSDLYNAVVVLASAVTHLEKKFDMLCDGTRADDRRMEERFDRMNERLIEKVHSVSLRVSSIEGRIDAYREMHMRDPAL